MKVFIDIAGWGAALLILAAYSLVSFGRLQPKSATYQWLNIAGALGFIVNCAWNHAMPSVALNVVWVGIGIYALLHHRR